MKMLMSIIDNELYIWHNRKFVRILLKFKRIEDLRGRDFVKNVNRGLKLAQKMVDHRDWLY